jgi:hypothetical protein
VQEQFESTADAVREGPSNSVTARRGFLGWMGRVGLAVVGGVSGITALSGTAHADPESHCCNLGSSYVCGGDGPNYLCPEGYMKRVWYCSMGGQTYGCGECTSGSNCRSGEFACSKVWAA